MASVRTGPLGTVAAVFLVAENRLLREALIRLLSKKDDIRIVGSGPYSPQVLQQILAVEPNIVVLDSVSKALSQDGVIRRLREARPEIGVVMVGMESDQDVFLRLVREGVLGYVLTDASAIEVWRAIRDVAAGEAVAVPGMTDVASLTEHAPYILLIFASLVIGFMPFLLIHIVEPSVSLLPFIR